MKTERTVVVKAYSESAQITEKKFYMMGGHREHTIAIHRKEMPSVLWDLLMAYIKLLLKKIKYVLTGERFYE